LHKNIKEENLITEKTKNIEETRELALRLAQSMKNLPKPVIIFLNGDLGAGKTTFVRYFASAWNLQNEVTSPTFTLMNQYQDENFCISHFDLYRLDSAEEAEELGLTDFISRSDFAFIEWPEIARSLDISPQIEI